METIQQQVFEKVREILENKKEQGATFAEMLGEITKQLKQNENTIRGYLVKIKDNLKDVENPERGFYILKEYLNDSETPTDSEKKEEKLYEPFASYLMVTEQCMNAKPSGHLRMGTSFANPDVIGVYKPSLKDIIKFSPEIISAEIKVSKNPSELIKGFGQAVSYKLFSHKVYLVIPDDVDKKNVLRLKSLCTINGIGLVTFNGTPTNPEWTLICSPIKSEPDYFYLNNMIDEQLDFFTDLI